MRRPFCYTSNLHKRIAFPCVHIQLIPCHCDDGFVHLSQSHKKLLENSAAVLSKVTMLIPYHQPYRAFNLLWMPVLQGEEGMT